RKRQCSGSQKRTFCMASHQLAGCSDDLVLTAYLIRLMSVSSASAQKSLQKKRSPLPFQAEVSASARPHAAQVRLCISLSAILTKAQTLDPRKQSCKLADSVVNAKEVSGDELTTASRQGEKNTARQEQAGKSCADDGAGNASRGGHDAHLG